MGAHHNERHLSGRRRLDDLAGGIPDDNDGSDDDLGVDESFGCACERALRSLLETLVEVAQFARRHASYTLNDVQQRHPTLLDPCEPDRETQDALIPVAEIEWDQECLNMRDSSALAVV